VLAQTEPRAPGDAGRAVSRGRGAGREQVVQLERGGFLIFPLSLLGRWVQQLKKRDAMVSDKLIKLSLLSIICTVKKRNLIVFAVPDKNQEKCLHIFSVLSLFLMLFQ